jgi:hypothetical protein
MKEGQTIELNGYFILIGYFGCLLLESHECELWMGDLCQNGLEQMGIQYFPANISILSIETPFAGKEIYVRIQFGVLSKDTDIYSMFK